MKITLIISMLFFTTPINADEKYYKIVPVKYCISTCMDYEFKRFHSRGSSWGTGSSSLAGLAQTQIYDRVKQECVAFYNDEVCCHTKMRDYKNVLKTYIHGVTFGACKGRFAKQPESKDEKD